MKYSMQKCSRAPHLIHWVGSCLPPAQCPSLHNEGLQKEGVSRQQAPQKVRSPLLARQQDTVGVVHLWYNAPEAKAPRQLVCSSKPIYLLLQKSHWLLSSLSVSVPHSWSDPLWSRSTTLKQQKVNGQPSAGLAHRNHSTWLDEPRGDAREVALQLPVGWLWLLLNCSLWFWFSWALLILWTQIHNSHFPKKHPICQVTPSSSPEDRTCRAL